MAKLKAVLATTHIDSHFQRFTLEVLEEMAEFINGSAKPPIMIEHDATLPPLGKTLEARVEQREDGEFQVVAVQEFFDSPQWTALDDGMRLFKQESQIDHHPFLDKYGSMPEGYALTYDPVNFESDETIEQFIQDIKYSGN